MKITETDNHYYERKEQENINRRKALSKAAHRVEVYVGWYNNNTLTKTTMPEFKKVMKQADKNWEVENDT